MASNQSEPKNSPYGPVENTYPIIFLASFVAWVIGAGMAPQNTGLTTLGFMSMVGSAATATSLILISSMEVGGMVLGRRMFKRLTKEAAKEMNKKIEKAEAERDAVVAARDAAEAERKKVEERVMELEKRENEAINKTIDEAIEADRNRKDGESLEEAIKRLRAERQNGPLS